MAYVKTYKVVPDSAVGFATINSIAANAAELRTQMLIQHGGDESWYRTKGAGPIDYAALGRHNLVEVARSVGYAGTFVQTLTSTGIAMTWTGPGIPLVWKVGTGDYLMPVVGLSRFWATVTPVGGTSVTYLSPQVRPFFATVANGNNAGLRINTFALNGSSVFAAADMSFAIALYGTP